MVTLKDIEKKLQGKFEVTDFQVHTNYIVKLGKSGTINIHFKNDEFSKIMVDGIDKEKIEDCLK